MNDAVARLIGHVAQTRYEDLPEAALHAARTFLLDSLGVAAVGSMAPWADRLAAIQAGWGAGSDARSWVFGDPLPAPAAAFVNAYQLHNSEFDCIHEAAIVHPMAVVLPALLAAAERRRGVNGRDFILALILGVDVACHIGVAAQGRMRFFRPAMAGAFGAVAAIGKLNGFDADTLRSAMGVVYSQLCGTMQAHHEGSVVLAMQVGFNARNAVIACDMAADGIVAPADMLEGPYGYYALFEEGHDLAGALGALGQDWRIAEVAHKPFPSGRATHGVIDGLLALQASKGFAAADIAHIQARVPPLTHQLVGRVPQDAMSPNQARLCIAFSAARALQKRGLGVADFLRAALADAQTLDLARRITVVKDDNPDPNALTPVAFIVGLRDGREFNGSQSIVYGNPKKPMSRSAHLAKFHANWRAADLPPANASRLTAMVDDIEAVPDMAELVDLMLR